MGGLLGRGREIRVSGSLLEVLTGVRLVDHHAHGVLRERPTLDEFRGLHSESHDPRQWPHVATGLTYRRAIVALAELFGVEASENVVLERRLAMPFEAYTQALLRAAGLDWLLVDDGYPPPGEGIEWRELGKLAGCRSLPVLRLERVAEEEPGQPLEHVRAEVGSARARGLAALKTIAAYRGGLDLERLPQRRRDDRLEGPLVRGVLLAALEANEETGDPLPVQVHAGFGDADLFLPSANPALLKPLIERFRETPFVLLHNYPYVREAGWLAHVYGNVWLDLSLTIPHVARPAELLREALELAPVSKLLYGSDAARTPELYYLAAKWWREALAEVLAAELPPGEAESAARAILGENARSLYRLV